MHEIKEELNKLKDEKLICGSTKHTTTALESTSSTSLPALTDASQRLSRGICPTILSDEAVGLACANAEKALDNDDVLSKALDELTSLMLFEEECESADVDNSDLKFGKLLGKGSFGYVMQASWKSTPVAVKVIRSFVGSGSLSVDSMSEFVAELQTWKALRHPNVVQLLGTCFKKEEKIICFVMELCEKTLGQLIHLETSAVINTAFIQSLGQDITRGLEHLHSKGIRHGDIKPKNVLLIPAKDIPRAKICDFGMTLARQETATLTLHSSRHGGTLAYMGPELLKLPPLLV